MYLNVIKNILNSGDVIGVPILVNLT
jgi:hypothetical protein